MLYDRNRWYYDHDYGQWKDESTELHKLASVGVWLGVTGCYFTHIPICLLL